MRFTSMYNSVSLNLFCQLNYISIMLQHVRKGLFPRNTQEGKPIATRKLFSLVTIQLCSQCQNNVYNIAASNFHAKTTSMAWYILQVLVLCYLFSSSHTLHRASFTFIAKVTCSINKICFPPCNSHMFTIYSTIEHIQ